VKQVAANFLESLVSNQSVRDEKGVELKIEIRISCRKVTGLLLSVFS
jgi:hypothetical protein